MTADQQQIVKDLIERLSNRVGTCENKTDRALMAEAVGHLVMYSLYKRV